MATIDRSSLVIEKDIYDLIVSMDEEEKAPEENEHDVDVGLGDDEMYAFLGLGENDNGTVDTPLNQTSAMEDVIEGEDISVDVEENSGNDSENITIDLGSTFTSMKKFRSAMYHFAVVGQFVVKTKKTEPTRYYGACTDPKCHRRIVAKKVQGQETIAVTEIGPVHVCASCSRKKSPMTSKNWVADRAMPILRLYPNMQAKELKTKLDNEYNCSIEYHTVWKGREIAINKLHGTRAESFQMLYNYKAEMELRSPNSVVEIDTENVDGSIYFKRCFIAFSACIEGFMNGCRPYISIDATALNGKWNGQLAAVTALIGHNWMFPLAFGFFDVENIDNWQWFMEQVKKYG